MGIVFGPVPSRRLGQSLGINNIPAKTCPYDCVYCQLGRTTRPLSVPRAFCSPGPVFKAVQGKLHSIREAGHEVDYLTFVPDGEPTLDAFLGRSIERLKSLGIPVAVISNGALLWRREVRESLRAADRVSVKVDTVRKEAWRRINRPVRALHLDLILQGVGEFSRSFPGELDVEVMLVRGINDDLPSVRKLAQFLGSVSLHRVYVSVPTRPPAESWVRPPEEETICSVYQAIREKIEHVEYLISDEGDDFPLLGEVEQALLSIGSVHPLRERTVTDFLERSGSGRELLERLIRDGLMVEIEYGGEKFYLKKLPGPDKSRGNRASGTPAN